MLITYAQRNTVLSCRTIVQFAKDFQLERQHGQIQDSFGMTLMSTKQVMLNNYIIGYLMPCNCLVECKFAMIFACNKTISVWLRFLVMSRYFHCCVTKTTSLLANKGCVQICTKGCRLYIHCHCQFQKPFTVFRFFNCVNYYLVPVVIIPFN